jgi:hypothetical protein
MSLGLLLESLMELVIIYAQAIQMIGILTPEISPLIVGPGLALFPKTKLL